MGSTLTNLIIHVVFSTKNRDPVIDSRWEGELHAYLGGIVKNEGGIPLTVGGIEDHVHLVVKLKPTHALSDVLQKVKGGSSKWVNDRRFLTCRFSWQEGYAAFSVSESLVHKVVEYVKNQRSHHENQTFQDEYRSLLKLHGVPFDERYLWG